MKIQIENTIYPILTCTKFKDRLLGLLFKKEICPLCFPNCNAIHTFFMRKKIDVVMTDQKGTILYIYPSFSPWKWILPKKRVFFTYEFPEKTVTQWKCEENINQYIQKEENYS